jgi:hypothetical protein
LRVMLCSPFGYSRGPPGESAIDARVLLMSCTMRVSLQKRCSFLEDTWVRFVDFVTAFGTVPREMLFKVLAPVLSLCYTQAVLKTRFPKFEAAGVERLMCRSMQPEPAVDGVSVGSLMVEPAVFQSTCTPCQRTWSCTLAISPLPLRRSHVVLHRARSPHPCSRRAQSKCLGLRYGTSARRVQNASRAESVPCLLILR